MQNKGGVKYLTETELKLQIKEKNFAPCYCFFGEEQFLIRNYIEKIVTAATGSKNGLDVSRFDGAVKAQAIYDAVMPFPMTSPKRVVTVCDYPFEKAAATENEKLLAAVSDMPASTVLILWFETVEINPKRPGDKYNKLFRAVKEAGGEVCLLERKNTADLMRMLQSGAARRKCRLGSSTARYMVETCSDDLSVLVNELEKLCMYVGENGVIMNETVDRVCSRSTEASVYGISKAVLRNDLGAAYRILDDLMFMNTEPSYILTVLASAYVDMYRCCAASASGKSESETASEFGYFNTAFRLADAGRNARKFSEKQLARFLGLLAEADRTVKGSRCGGRTVIEETIVKLAAASEDRS